MERIIKLNNKIQIILNNSKIYINNNINNNKILLPSKYFIIKNNNIIKLIFLNKLVYANLLNLIKKVININIFFIRLKIKGLGYKIRKITKNLFYLFFNYPNAIYLHNLKNLLIKWNKKKLIFISTNFNILKLTISTIILLKKLGPYQLRGIKYPRQIILIKKRKKKL